MKAHLNNYLLLNWISIYLFTKITSILVFKYFWIWNKCILWTKELKFRKGINTHKKKKSENKINGVCNKITRSSDSAKTLWQFFFIYYIPKKRIKFYMFSDKSLILFLVLKLVKKWERLVWFIWISCTFFFFGFIKICPLGVTCLLT